MKKINGHPTMPIRKRILWIFLTGAMIYGVATAFRAGIPGMVFDLIRQQFGISAARTSGIASWRTFGSMLFIGFSGFLIDTGGWRRWLLTGAAMQTAGYLLIGGGTGVPMLYAGAFINGAGMTITYLSLLKLLDAEFPSRCFSLMIGVFYLFGYGGTLLGTTPFAGLLPIFSWQQILFGGSGFTLLLMVLLAGLFLSGKPATTATSALPRRRTPIPWRELGRRLATKPGLAIFLVTASSLGLYWSMLVGTAGKYLADTGIGSGPLALMNLIAMVEMIGGGAVSFLCGNRRKCFQITGAVLNASALLLVLTGTFCSGHAAAILTWFGLAMLGAGYGFTCINITAVREIMPPGLAATAIGLVNLAGDLLIIGLSQFSGALFDRFRSTGLTVEPNGYRLLFAVYAALALTAVPATRYLRETRGRNISSDR
ncbi:MAG: MFS transporter [Lentisphaeria bacterium]|nr:MFS transporter [Lentisphaeria bacterium]